MKFWLFLLFFTSVYFTGWTQQGKLVLIGGGTEYRDAWSDTPYQWAVNQSENKKVAVIGYDLGTDPDWIPEYFIDLGATSATNFLIDSREKANLQSLIDEIATHDVLFFKGGDQSRYYEYYNDTKLEDAILSVFKRGGVLAGTSAGAAMLAGICFTAENGSAYPEEVIANIDDPRISLRQDFLNVLPGVIVDTHFIERGRLGRLMGFLAHWKQNTGEKAIGVGIDDQTALCIDDQNIGTAYGTGAVLILNNGNFNFGGNQLSVDSIQATQLLHEETYDFNTGNKLTANESWSPEITAENGNYTLLFSGDRRINNNRQFLEDLALLGNDNDSLLIVSRPGSTMAASYRSELSASGNLDVIHLSISHLSNSPDSAALRNHIRRTSKILFIDNQVDSLIEFINGGPTGKLLAAHISRNDQIVAFVGEDGALAGKTLVNNHSTNELNAYRGNLEFSPGLGLLKTSFLMPNTYNAAKSDFYENKIASLLFALGADSLKFGLYLSPGSYLKFENHEGSNRLRSLGNKPVIMVSHAQGEYHLNSRANRNNYIRAVAGFEKVWLFSLTDENPMVVGASEPFQQEPYEFEREPEITFAPSASLQSPSVSPNPARDYVYLKWQEYDYTATLKDVTGKMLLKNNYSGSTLLNCNFIPRGVYFLELSNRKNIYRFKLIFQ